MKVEALETARQVAGTVADRIAAVLDRSGEALIAWPTGRTPLPLYDELARRHERRALDLSRSRGFNLDELVLPASHPASFHSYMERYAWGRTGLVRERCDIPVGEAPHLTAECRRYDAALSQAGTFDLVILGVGADGHVAYNLPGPPVEDTHVVAVPERVADALAIAPAERPLRAITMGLGPIRTARAIVLMATGAAKRAALRALLEGPPDPQWPCSLLREHPALEVIASREALGGDR